MNYFKTLLYGVLMCSSTLAFSQIDDSEENLEEHYKRSDLFDSLKLAKYPKRSGGAKYYPKARVNGKKITEKWSYFNLVNDETFELHISYRQGTTEYTEIYRVYEGQLLSSYISEDEYYDGFDEQVSISWSYECFWLDGKMVWMSSNGHGRTESDEWDAELEVNEWFAKRMKELDELFYEHE